jgi:hypothetical protein
MVGEGLKPKSYLDRDYSIGWSFSRLNSFQRCQYMYYLERIKPGWIELPQNQKKDVESIRKLQPLPIIVGEVIHRAIAHYFRTCQNQNELTKEDFEIKVKEVFKELLDRDNTFEGAYLIKDEFQIKVEEAVVKLQFLIDEFWQMTERLAIGTAIRAAPSSIFIDHDDEPGPIYECRIDGFKFYGTPDLVYLGGDGTYHLVSWKTGNSDPDGFLMQLAAQILFCIHNLGIDANMIVGRVINLNRMADPPVEIRGNSPILISCVNRMKREVEGLKEMYIDSNYGIPKSIKEFALAESIMTCTVCKFNSVCEGP